MVSNNEKMIGLKLLGNEKAEMVEFNKPIAKDDQVVIKMESLALCGSDINLRYRPGIEEGRNLIEEIRIDYDPESIPRHEITGIVAEFDKATSLKVGDRVFVFPIIPSKKSVYYQDRLWKYSKPISVIGYSCNGGNAEYLIAPEMNCYRLPEFVSPDQAAMILDPIGAPYGAIDRLNVNYLNSVLILGVGPIGLGTTMICNFIGVKNIIVVDLVKEHLDLAGELGANHLLNIDKKDLSEPLMDITDNRGPDVVIDCIGDKESFKQALKIVKPQGRIGVIGEPGYVDNISVSDLIIHKDLIITGS